MKATIRLGLIGNGAQMRHHHHRYLSTRAVEAHDTEIAWVSGCACAPADRGPAGQCEMAGRYNIAHCDGHLNDWRHLLDADRVDGVVISTPNLFHTDTISEALRRGVNVAVDKPPMIISSDCTTLADLADANGLVFVTLAQRRYEDVYLAALEHVTSGDIGEVRMVQYLISHGFDVTPWRRSKRLAGGGALIDCGFHGIDTVLWLLRQAPDPSGTEVQSVSAQCGMALPEPGPADDPADAVEAVACVRARLRGGGIFTVTASYAAPHKSLDENLKIFGTNGALRYMRDRPKLTDMAAGTLSYQSAAGAYHVYNTSSWGGRREAPLEDFVNAVIARKQGRGWQVRSPARESLPTIRLIERAYESAELGGQELLA